MSTPPGMPPACAYLFYDDIGGAVRFLCSAFGFSERFVSKKDDGTIEHAQVQRGSCVVMLGPTHAKGLLTCRNPKEAGSLNAGVYVFVEDVDAHARAAKEAGANVMMEPTDFHWGDRMYCATDPEGQFWMFATYTMRRPPSEASK
jgi:uncharacterized glyoxalase superfamily protein PhnB